jgi:hypothetical protein
VKSSSILSSVALTGTHCAGLERRSSRSCSRTSIRSTSLLMRLTRTTRVLHTGLRLLQTLRCVPRTIDAQCGHVSYASGNKEVLRWSSGKSFPTLMNKPLTLLTIIPSTSIVWAFVLISCQFSYLLKSSVLKCGRRLRTVGWTGLESCGLRVAASYSHSDLLCGCKEASYGHRHIY